MSTVDAAAASDPYAALAQGSTSGTSGKGKADDPGSTERFLKMLVTQLQNQDPLNPMDNAQITSQIAQINAVTGLEKVNSSIQSLSGQFLQMQMMQGAGLIGREVMVQGDEITVAGGVGRGAVELAGSATSVKVEVLGAGEKVVDTLDLGALEGGRTAFEWNPGTLDAGAGYTFRVTAVNGKEAVSSRTLAIDRVQSVSTVGDKLALTLSQLGTAAAASIVAFN